MPKTILPRQQNCISRIPFPPPLQEAECAGGATSPLFPPPYPTNSSALQGGIPNPPGPKINLVKGGTPSHHPPNRPRVNLDEEDEAGWQKVPPSLLMEICCAPTQMEKKAVAVAAADRPKPPRNTMKQPQTSRRRGEEIKNLGRRWPGSSCTCGPASTPTTKDPLVTGCQFAVVSVSLLKSVFFACSLM